MASIFESVKPAVEKATGVVDTVLKDTVKQLDESMPKKTVWPVPPKIQVQRFKQQTPDSLLYIYQKYGEQKFWSYVDSMFDLMRKGYE